MKVKDRKETLKNHTIFRIKLKKFIEDNCIRRTKVIMDADMLDDFCGKVLDELLADKKNLPIAQKLGYATKILCKETNTLVTHKAKDRKEVRERWIKAHRGTVLSIVNDVRHYIQTRQRRLHQDYYPQYTAADILRCLKRELTLTKPPEPPKGPETATVSGGAQNEGETVGAGASGPNADAATENNGGSGPNAGETAPVQVTDEQIAKDYDLFKFYVTEVLPKGTGNKVDWKKQMFQYETISGSFKDKVAGKNNVPPNTEALIAWMWENIMAQDGPNRWK